MGDRWKLYKKCDDFRVQAPRSVQDIIEIKSIAENGIFEIGTGGVYTKCYTFSDINYATASGEEQEAMLNAWCRWLNTNSEKFKITINNRNRDMDRLENEILFSEMGDNADELRDAYNDIIMRNLREGCQGIEREMYITVRYENARSYEDARNYFDNLEAHMTRDFMNLGSVLTPLDAKARLKVVHDIFRMGREQSFDFDMDEAVRVGYDFKDILIVFAPFLIIIMIAAAAGGAGEKASEELYRVYVASATDAMPADAVIAKDAQFVWPVSGRYYVTSVFGPRWGTIHGGIDLDARLNTPILAGADGTVRSAGYESSMGNYVIINHGVRNGQTVETVYMHNNRLAVSTGDTVKAGQVIAYAGETGEAFGVHCHFEVHINGNKVNPAPYLGLPTGIGEGDVTLFITK